MADVAVEIDQLEKSALSELGGITDAAGLEQFRIKYLGTNGLLKATMKLMGQVPKEQKPVVGARLNAAKESVTSAFEQKKTMTAAPLSKHAVDVTEPGAQPTIGNRHILMQTVDDLTALFARMGFAIAAGPEVEDEFHNFVALNIPRQHPARDPNDNFYVSAPAADGKSTASAAVLDRDPSQVKLLRTQTSTVQIRVMQSQTPPIRVVIPGRVYRPDTVDATHLFQFHQLEALVVDKNVTMVDLKSTILQFVHAYFGPDTKVRLRPSFFPFTEPSAEVDVWFEDKQRWIELGGCGMVHPNVFKACGIDPEVHSGWAFGFGIERIAMRKYGLTDIRALVENDLRFLRQF